MFHREVLVTGTFNLCHAGHCRLLAYAAEFGAVTVGINAQSYLDGKYGSAAVALDDRIFVLESNRWVDEVIVFEEDTPSELISRLRPKYYVKGPDYKGVRLPEDAALLEVGTTLLIRPGIRKYSSTELVSSKA